MGIFYYGDNLDILRRYIKDVTVDLVYFDPPFNSAQDYNAFFHEKDGSAAASQIKAFEDTWHWDTDAARPPTGPMEAEASSAGFYEHKTNGQKYPRIQLRTVKELMEGKGIERPSSAASIDETFKKAPSSKGKSSHQQELTI